MQPLQNGIGLTIRISRESWCLPYAEFFLIVPFPKCNTNLKISGPGDFIGAP